MGSSSFFCYYWVYATIPWNQGNWTWAECELVQEICATWGKTGNFWRKESLIWSECSSSVFLCPVWGSEGTQWKTANWWWSLCFGSGSNPPIPPIPSASFTGSLQPLGLDATTIVQPWLIEPWNPYTAADEHDKKRKRLIKLICKVKGQTYEEEKRVGDMKISVDDIRMVVKAVSNIDLDVKLEE